MSNQIKLFVVSCLIFLALGGCSSEVDEAKRLGFSNVEEMTKIQAQGWHTKTQYDQDKQIVSPQLAADKTNEERIKKLQDAGYCYGMAQYAMSLGLKLEVLIPPQVIGLFQEKYLSLAETVTNKAMLCSQKNMSHEQCFPSMNAEELSFYKKYVVGFESPKERKLDVENVKLETMMVCALLK